MGRDARLGLVERKNDAAAEKVMAEVAEDQMGPVRPWRVYSRGCPKCAADAKAQRKEYCPGKDARLEGLKRNACMAEGEHLHARCDVQAGGCGHFWREACADSEDDRR